VTEGARTQTPQRPAQAQPAPGPGLAIARWADSKPDRPAISSAHGDRTYAELDANANRLARALRRRGVVVGDQIALVCSNRPEFAEVLQAGLRSGLRVTPVNWHLSGDEVAYILSDSGAKALISDVRFAGTCTEAMAATDVGVGLAIGGSIHGFEDYEPALEAEDPSALDDPAPGSTMLYTSGTTGRPKGVFRPPGGAGAGAQATGGGPLLQALQVTLGEDVHLCTGPLYHAAPLAFSLNIPLATGATIVLMDGWDPEETLRLVQDHGVTHTHMVPTMFHRLVSLPDEVRSRYDTSSLRSVLHGAAPCPVPVKQALIEWLGPIVYEYYAATEGWGSFVDSETWQRKPGSVGQPADGQIEIRGDDGNVLPAGEVGTVYLKAPDDPATRFQYYNDPDKTARAYGGDHFTLGDMGYLDEDGHLFLTDRTADLIISGGVNIYPAEVDAVLLTHPAVGDACTIGVPNEEWGEEVKSVIELRDGVEPSEALAAELIAHCRDRLARYKCPRSVDFVDELPRHETGKLYRRLVRERYRARGDT